MTQLPNLLTVRSVVVVALPNHIPRGREQQGQRPAVVVTLPSVTGATRYSLVVIVPTTTQVGNWVLRNPMLYPSLQAGVGNLPYDSVVLLDQIRCIDRRRVLGLLGNLTADEYQPIENGLRAMLRF